MHRALQNVMLWLLLSLSNENGNRDCHVNDTEGQQQRIRDDAMTHSMFFFLSISLLLLLLRQFFRY